MSIDPEIFGLPSEYACFFILLHPNIQCLTVCPMQNSNERKFEISEKWKKAN